MTLDGRQLTAFLAVASCGSLGRAADQLHLTQPALSRTIRRLEVRLGAPLFERHPTGMVLTAFGEALRPRAQLLQREAAQAVEEIEALRGLARGTIRVGAVASVASVVLPMAVDRVLARWPNLRVSIIEGVWDRLADALLGREIDLALGVAVHPGEDIVAIPECGWHDASQVVAAVDHPLRQRPVLHLRDTLDCRWATAPRGTAPYEEMRRIFESHDLAPPTITVESRSIVVLKSLVARAGFVGWMAQPMYDAERHAGLVEALPIAGATMVRQLAAFRRRHGILPGPAAKLVEALREVAGQTGARRQPADRARYE